MLNYVLSQSSDLIIHDVTPWWQSRAR